MAELPTTDGAELLRDLQTDLDEVREDLGNLEVRLGERLVRAVDRLTALTRTLQDGLYLAEDRIRRLENRT